MLVIDSNRAAQQLDAVEIVDGQDGALLVLVLDEAESLWGNANFGNEEINHEWATVKLIPYLAYTPGRAC